MLKTDAIVGLQQIAQRQWTCVLRHQQKSADQFGICQVIAVPMLQSLRATVWPEQGAQFKYTW